MRGAFQAGNKGTERVGWRRTWLTGVRFRFVQLPPKVSNTEAVYASDDRSDVRWRWMFAHCPTTPVTLYGCMQKAKLAFMEALGMTYFQSPAGAAATPH